ncbi:ROK family protein [Enemella evansiae]|uniref:ROK family protein n=1 Tax=Enemella evansiae TaxID=2016499 RepID=UPI00105B7E4C|nr:ROK family protein [Enemella evansiae]TDO91652.1 putative NBD/HSP70 family sugar kinase [Enemella evansiae]
MGPNGTVEHSDPAPSLDLVRDTTDRQVLSCFFTAPEPTRPAIAQQTGISKPTVSSSIRRLAARGLVTEAGLATGGVGRAGQRYRLGGRFAALALHIGPGGARAELVDIRGEALGCHREPVGVFAVRPGEVADAVGRILTAVRAEQPGPLPVACSFAGPVNAAGVAIDMPLSPFLVGSLDLAGLLGSAGGPAPVIDNDVNWAALAQLAAGGVDAPHSFLQVYLGEGLGGAVVAGGRVVTGHRGLGGELAYLPTVAPDGSSTSLLDALRQSGLLVRGATTVEVDRVREALREGGAVSEQVHRAVAAALSGAVALLDPEEIVLGGPWGDELDHDRLQRELDQLTQESVRVRSPLIPVDGPFAGARQRAVQLARDALLDRVAAPS